MKSGLLDIFMTIFKYILFILIFIIFAFIVGIILIFVGILPTTIVIFIEKIYTILRLLF